MGDTFYLSLLFQWPKNVQKTFFVCPSNVVDFWWVVIVTDFNIVTTRSPHPIDNRELAKSYRQFQFLHYLYREYQCIIFYLFPPSTLITFIIFIAITNALISFYRQFQCVYNLYRENLSVFADCTP